MMTAIWLKRGWVAMGLMVLLGVCGALVLDQQAFAEEIEFLRELRADFVEPVDVGVTDNGDTYVLDGKSAKVFVFSPDGMLKSSFGAKGVLPGQNLSPVALAISHFGEVIVADQGNNHLQVYTPTGEWAYQIGNSGSSPGEFKRISSVAVDPLGYIYVADTGSKRITRYTPKGVFLNVRDLDYAPEDLAFDVQGNMFVLDTVKGRVVKYLFEGGKVEILDLTQHAEKNLAGARCLTVDGRGDIYLAEWDKQSIVKIDQARTVLLSFGSEGEGRGQFLMVRNVITQASDILYVADSRNRRVQIFVVKGSDKAKLAALTETAPMIDYEQVLYTGKDIVDLDVTRDKGLFALAADKGQIIRLDESRRVLGTSDKEEFRLKRPQALFVEPDGRLIVADTGNQRLQFLNQDGTYRYHFGRKGKDRSEFNEIGGVAVDSAGFIYIADSYNNRIQVFNPDGIYLRAFGRKTKNIDAKGAEAGTFSVPKDIAFNSKDELFVLDYKNRRIEIFDREGKYRREIGGARDQVQFNDPIDLAIDEKDYLFVADRGDFSVKIISPEGKLVLQFGSAGQGPGHFPSLSAIASQQGKVYVANDRLDKVVVYHFDPLAGKPEPTITFSRTSKAMKMDNASEMIRVTMARKITFEDAKKEVADKLNLTAAEAGSLLKIVSEKVLDSGQVELTLSLPKATVPQGIEFVSRK